MEFVDRMGRRPGWRAELSPTAPACPADDERYEALNEVERHATLVWVAVGRIAVDGWEGWVESLGHRTGGLIEALRAIDAAGLAEVAEQLRDLYPLFDADDPDKRLLMPTAQATSARVVELQRQWFTLVRTTRPLESHLARWIRRHPTEMPSTVDDL